MRDYVEYPKWKYHPEKDAVLCPTHNDEVALGDGWFDKPDMTDHAFDMAEAAMSAHPPGYVAVEYPKMLYHPEREPKVVENGDDEAASLDAGWFQTPDFTKAEALPDDVFDAVELLTEDELSALRKSDLVELAEAEGATFDASGTKAEIVAAILANRSGGKGGEDLL